MNRKSLSGTPLLILIMLLATTCQEEKYTDKGIPEVELTSVIAIEGQGAVFEGRILSTGSEEITEHGFLWDTDNNPLPATAEKVLLGPRQDPGTFTCIAAADIRKGQQYFARAFMVTAQHTSLGAITTFTGKGSIPAQLISVIPSEAVCGDTVVIRGKYFSFTPANNIVRFDGTPGKIISSGPEEITVTVPLAEEHPVSLRTEVSGQQSTNSLPLDIKPPVLTSFSPLTGTFNDTVTLSGSYFSIDTSFVRVFFNGNPAEIISMSRTQYVVKVPALTIVSSAKIKIKYFSTFLYSEWFNLKQAVISEVNPSRVKAGDIIYIRGENFNPLLANNLVMIGDRRAWVVSGSATEIAVLVPPGLQAGNHSLSLVTLQGNPVTWPGTIEYYFP